MTFLPGTSLPEVSPPMILNLHMLGEKVEGKGEDARNAGTARRDQIKWLLKPATYRKIWSRSFP